ncbi:MAG TPA: hypothetical protein VF447_08785, partial [Terriglobales bacterium]
AVLKRYAMTLALTFGVVLLAGCDEPLPTCSDPAIQDLVKQILFNEMAKQTQGMTERPGWLENAKKVAKIKLAMVRTTATNERYGRQSCEAQLQAQLPNDAGAIDVQYSIQQSDDKKDILVQMTGHAPLALVMGISARKLEFSPATTDVPALQSVPAPSASPKPPQPVAVARTPPSTAVRTVADVTVIWLDCEDLCHLQYKTAQGELKSALCTEAPICQQWSGNPPEFKKHVGSHATLKLGSQFVPEGGVTLDSVQGLEWGS